MLSVNICALLRSRLRCMPFHTRARGALRSRTQPKRRSGEGGTVLDFFKVLQAPVRQARGHATLLDCECTCVTPRHARGRQAALRRRSTKKSRNSESWAATVSLNPAARVTMKVRRDGGLRLCPHNNRSFSRCLAALRHGRSERTNSTHRRSAQRLLHSLPMVTHAPLFIRSILKIRS